MKTIYEKVQEKARNQGMDIGVTLDGIYLLYPSDKHYNVFKNLVMKGTLYKINAYLNECVEKVA